MKKFIIFAAIFAAVALAVVGCVATKLSAGCSSEGCYIKADSIAVMP